MMPKTLESLDIKRNFLISEAINRKQAKAVSTTMCTAEACRY